jgi:nucleoside-diphosphate-sugar epimerase
MYIKDMLTAFHKALNSDKALGATMIIGGDEIITTRQLVDTFAKAMQFPRPKLSLPYPVAKLMAITAESLFAVIGKEPPVSRRTLEFFDTDNGFDISRSKSLLDFTPAYTFQQGMVDYAADNATTRP